jgi:hypothetical protein
MTAYADYLGGRGKRKESVEHMHIGDAGVEMADFVPGKQGDPSQIFIEKTASLSRFTPGSHMRDRSSSKVGKCFRMNKAVPVGA